VLLRLGRPVDVAERGLVFVQNFLAILAAREAAGLIKPWFKEVRYNCHYYNCHTYKYNSKDTSQAAAATFQRML
jgi:hypothetical protein